MATLRIRPSNALRDRLATMAAQRGVSGNKLMEGFSLWGLTEHDAETHFRSRAVGCNLEDGLTD